MSRCQEFIGVRCIEAANVHGEGKHLYNMHLTDTEIVRCRDCKIGKDDLPLTEVCKTYLANGCDPNGFCAWARLCAIEDVLGQMKSKPLKEIAS